MFCIRQWECGVIFIYMCVKRRLRVGIDIIWCYLHNDALKDKFLFHGIYKRHSYSYRCWLLSTVINGLQGKTMPNTEMNHISRRFKDVSLLAMKKIGFCRCSVSPILPSNKILAVTVFFKKRSSGTEVPYYKSSKPSFHICLRNEPWISMYMFTSKEMCG